MTDQAADVAVSQDLPNLFFTPPHFSKAVCESKRGLAVLRDDVWERDLPQEQHGSLREFKHILSNLHLTIKKLVHFKCDCLKRKNPKCN